MRRLMLGAAVLGVAVLGTTVWQWSREAVTVTTEPGVVWMPTPVPKPVMLVILDVPFATQAPFGEWEDPRQQDGCEEAAVLMAKCFVLWGSCPVSAGVIDRKFARDEMLRMAEHQREKYGSFTDTSAKDTGNRLLRGLYGIGGYEVTRVDSSEQMASMLMEGKILVAPADGRKLGNPFFRAGGPERHMLVVIGYDAVGREFITNDPGTRRGKGYRYAEDVLWEAMGDYLTGERRPIDDRPKMVISVRGSSRRGDIRR